MVNNLARLFLVVTYTYQVGLDAAINVILYT